MSIDGQSRGMSDLVSDALLHLSRIIRGEVALAQSEMAASMQHAKSGIGLLIVGMVFGIVALNLLATSLVAAVVYAGLAPGWAALVVAAGFALAALLAVRSGAAALKPMRLVPKRALQGLRNDVETLKEGLMP